MSLHETRRLLAATLALLGMLVWGSAIATAAKPAHHHHDAKDLLADKRDGHHDIDHHGKFTASVEMKGGKVAEFHVRHSEKGEIPVKKYMSHTKMAQEASAHIVNASLVLAHGGQDTGTVYIGYSYIDDDGNEEIYWVPADMVVDPYTGAVEYVAAD
jgi:hypothetical protein